MTDVPVLDVDHMIATRDAAVREATRQIVAGVLELRAAIGSTPYVTTMLDTVADVTQVLDQLSRCCDIAERWLDKNAASTVDAGAGQVDAVSLVKDLRRDLKGVNAALSAQHRHLYKSIAPAWTRISHRPGVIGRETW